MKNKYIPAVSALTLVIGTSLTFAAEQQANEVPTESLQTFGIVNVPSFPNPQQILGGTPGSYAVVSYTLENLTNNPIYNVTLKPITGVTQIVESPYYCGDYVPSGSSNNTCGLGRMDGSFYLGPRNTSQGSCNLLLCVEGAAVDLLQGGIFSGPEVCTEPDLQVCDPAGQGVRFNLLLIDSEDVVPIAVENSSSCTFTDPEENLPTCIESNPDGTTEVTWHIVNEGDATAYQIVPNIATMDENLLAQLTMLDTSDCLALPEGESCDITAVVPADAPAVVPSEITFLGSNTNEVVNYTSIYVEPSLTFALSAEDVPVSGIVVKDTNSVEYTLTNNTDVPVTIAEIYAPTGVAGVTIDEECIGITLDAHDEDNDSCTITVSTDSEDPTAAYNTELGGGTVEVDYNYGPNGYVGTVPFTISVEPTTVTLNNEQPIELSLGTPEIDIVVTNTGNFDWQQVDFEFDNPIGGVTFDQTQCINVEGEPANTLPAGESCNLKFGTTALTSPPAIPTNAIVIANATVNGSNLAENVAESVSVHNITVTVDPEFDQLQYQRVLIANNTLSNTIQLTEKTLTGLTTDQAMLCSSSSTDCDGYNTNLCTSSTIGAGNSCYVLVKSVTDKDAGLSTASGALQLNLEDITNNATWIATFPVTQQQMLYVTGRFDRVGGITSANSIAAFDGTNWYALGAGLLGNIGNNTGSALKVYKGNLYAGGGFISAGGAAFTQYLATWDGSQWSSLTGSDANTYAFVTDGPVNAFTTDNTDTVCSSASINCNLLIGGGFTTITEGSTLKEGPVQPQNTIIAEGMALWNPANPALTSVSYNQGPTPVSYYGVQGAPSPTSEVAVNTLLNSTEAGASAFSGTFAGGSFLNSVAYTTSLNSLLSNNIANLQSYEAGWFAIPSTNPGVTSPSIDPVSVEALLFSGDALYVGGLFTHANGNTDDEIVNNIAVWDGSVWAAADDGNPPGFNGPVYALALFDNDQLYAGGAFTNLAAGGTPALNSLAVLESTDPLSWSNPITSGSLNNGSVNALYAFDDLLYVGGQYTGVGSSSVTLNNLATLNSAGELASVNGGVTFANGNPANVGAMLVTSSVSISNNSTIVAAERE